MRKIGAGVLSIIKKQAPSKLGMRETSADQVTAPQMELTLSDAQIRHK
jgi:hypothetical protein